MPESLPPTPPPAPVFLPFAHESQPAVFLPPSAELPTCPVPVYLPDLTPAA